MAFEGVQGPAVALTSSEQVLVRLFVCAVTGDEDALVKVLEGAEGVPDRRWREALLQVHLFAGFPRTIEAFEIFFRILGPDGFAPEASEFAADPREGDRLFDRIYASAADSVRGHLVELHPDLAAWVREHAYGRVLSRPGIAARMRELLAVAALCVTGPDRQFASHVRGAVRCGADPEEVLQTVKLVGDLMPSDRAPVVQTVLRRFAKTRSGDDGGPSSSKDQAP